MAKWISDEMLKIRAIRKKATMQQFFHRVLLSAVNKACPDISDNVWHVPLNLLKKRVRGKNIYF
jgi:hypothetical protein